MAHEIEYICAGITLLMVFLAGSLYGVGVFLTVIAVITAILYADAKRDGM